MEVILQPIVHDLYLTKQNFILAFFITTQFANTCVILVLFWCHCGSFSLHF